MQATRQKTQKGRALSILIADDEPDTVATLAAILEDEGHVIHSVTNGGLVREAVERFKPEVCILDIEMPGETGYSLAGHLSKMEPRERPVLIAISGKWKNQTDKLLARMVGFDYFLTKPAEPAELIAALDQLRLPPPQSA